MAVERHLAQLHAVRVGSRRRHYRDSGVQIPIIQTKCASKWDVQSFQRNGELRLQGGVTDADRGRAARFSIGRYQRVDVCGGQFHFALLMSARRFLHRIKAFANLGAFFARRGHACFTRRGRARFSRRSSFRDRCGFIRKIDVT